MVFPGVLVVCLGTLRLGVLPPTVAPLLLGGVSGGPEGSVAALWRQVRGWAPGRSELRSGVCLQGEPLRSCGAGWGESRWHSGDVTLGSGGVDSARLGASA